MKNLNLKNINLITRSLQLILFFCFCCVLKSQISFAQSENWKSGFGFGPNLTQVDVVNDELGSSYGTALWLSRSWSSNQRLDFNLDYLKFKGTSPNYLGLSIGYGLEFSKRSSLSYYGLVGFGIGQANYFPLAVNAHQNTGHVFARVGTDELFRIKKWSFGLLFDFLYIKLDGKPATQAQVGLPMVSINYSWQDDTKNNSNSNFKSSNVVSTEDLHLSNQFPVNKTLNLDLNTKVVQNVNSIENKPKKIVKSLRIHFQTAQFKILNHHLNAIYEFSKFLNDNPEYSIFIEGHTDSVGKHGYNMKLSNARATAVQNALIQYGKIDKARFKMYGYGPDKPMETNETERGKSLNRRVNAILFLPN